MASLPLELTKAEACRPQSPAWTLAILLVTVNVPTTAHAGECPTSASEIATDRPDVTKSSLVVPMGACRVKMESTQQGEDPNEPSTGPTAG